MKAGNIVILTQYFLPETGAPQSRLYETALALKRRGWNVIVVTALPNYPAGAVFPAYRGKWYVQDKIDGIEVHRFLLYPSNSPKKFPRIFSMLSFSITAIGSLFKVRRFKPDYIFTESPPLTLGLTGLMLAKLSGARHILNVSDLWPLSAYKLGAISQGRFYNMVTGLEKYLYMNSYACTGQSNEIITHILNEGGKKAHLFRNGVDTTRFSTLARQTLRANNDKLKIVYTGLLGVAQGVAGICRNINFSRLNAEFHIYGEGSEKAAIEDYLKEHPGTGIFYHGLAKREDIPAILANADITLIPLIRSIEGAVPSKIYESMAAGIPIIFSGGGEGAEIIKNYNTGWVCAPRKYTEISNCIRRLANSEKTELADKKANCISVAKNVFDREIQVEQLHKFLIGES